MVSMAIESRAARGIGKREGRKAEKREKKTTRAEISPPRPVAFGGGRKGGKSHRVAALTKYS